MMGRAVEGMESTRSTGGMGGSSGLGWGLSGDERRAGRGWRKRGGAERSAGGGRRRSGAAVERSRSSPSSGPTMNMRHKEVAGEGRGGGAVIDEALYVGEGGNGQKSRTGVWLCADAGMECLGDVLALFVPLAPLSPPSFGPGTTRSSPVRAIEYSTQHVDSACSRLLAKRAFAVLTPRPNRQLRHNTVSPVRPCPPRLPSSLVSPPSPPSPHVRPPWSCQARSSTQRLP